MSRGVKPKKVSPLIRGARYSFFIAGLLYGSSKKAIYTKIEAIAAPKRKAAIEKENILKEKQKREQNIKEIEALFEDFGFEPEPGWEKSV